MQFNPSVHCCLVGRPWLRDRGILPHADKPTPRRGAPDYTLIHSSRCPSPQRHRDDAWRELPAEKKKPSLFPPIIESNAEEEEKEAKLQNIKNNGIWQKAWSWPLSEGDGLISEWPLPTQTTVLAHFHCQHLRFALNFSMLYSQFLFPSFVPPRMIPPSSQTSVSLSVQHSRSFEIIHQHTNVN